MSVIRSTPGSGEPIAIYQLDTADHADSVIGCYGATAMCGSHGEDFAVCHWPVVLKVKQSVTREQLVAHLLDLAAAIEGQAFYLGPADPLDRWSSSSFMSVKHDRAPDMFIEREEE